MTSPFLDKPTRTPLGVLRDLMAQIENLTGHIAESEPDLADDMLEIEEALNYDALVRAEEIQRARETDAYNKDREHDGPPVRV